MGGFSFSQRSQASYSTGGVRCPCSGVKGIFLWNVISMLHVCSVRRSGDRQKLGAPSLQNRHQKRVVELPSLNSPEQSEGDGWCWANLQNTVFYGLKRKRRDFERSVLVYVSIKIPALTHSGRKSRVCVNQPDRLSKKKKKNI